MKELFRVTEKLIKDQRENYWCLSEQSAWWSTTLLCDKAREITTAKTYVFADSVPCLGGISTEPVHAWKDKHVIYKIWIGSTGNKWNLSGKNFPGFTTLGILGEIQKIMTELQCEPEQFKGRIIFVSMYNDIVWRERGHTEKSVTISIAVKNYSRKFLPWHWPFLGLGSEKKWYETYSDNWNGDWDKTAEILMLNRRSKNGHAIFRATSALGKRRIKK